MLQHVPHEHPFIVSKKKETIRKKEVKSKEQRKKRKGKKRRKKNRVPPFRTKVFPHGAAHSSRAPFYCILMGNGNKKKKRKKKRWGYRRRQRREKITEHNLKI